MSLARKVDIQTEKRLHERKNLAYENIPGEFCLEINGQKEVFSQVNDVSISGMGIFLERHIAEKTDLIVSYTSDDFQIAIPGTVIWSEKLDDKGCRIGVQLSSDNMDDNVMLFMTLREYIDDFGESF
ncbi:MAG: PilZ domain-containing protein [Gammaproteobacteria bacterium]|nr:PilZ domain-containing protein [Gammaproteobacteria bacterium]